MSKQSLTKIRRNGGYGRQICYTYYKKEACLVSVFDAEKVAVPIKGVINVHTIKSSPNVQAAATKVREEIEKLGNNDGITAVIK